jgi:hypothetical protein
MTGQPQRDLCKRRRVRIHQFAEDDDAFVVLGANAAKPFAEAQGRSPAETVVIDVESGRERCICYFLCSLCRRGASQNSSLPLLVSHPELRYARLSPPRPEHWPRLQWRASLPPSSQTLQIAKVGTCPRLRTVIFQALMNDPNNEFEAVVMGRRH